MKIPVGTKLWTVYGMERCGGLFSSRLFSRYAVTWFSNRLFRTEREAQTWTKKLGGFGGNTGNPWRFIVSELTMRDDSSAFGVSGLPEGYTPVYADCVNPLKAS